MLRSHAGQGDQQAGVDLPGHQLVPHAGGGLDPPAAQQHSPCSLPVCLVSPQRGLVGGGAMGGDDPDLDPQRPAAEPGQYRRGVLRFELGAKLAAQRDGIDDHSGPQRAACGRAQDQQASGRPAAGPQG